MLSLGSCTSGGWSTRSSQQWNPTSISSRLRRRWIAIVALALLGGILGYAGAATERPTYSASSSVFVSTPNGDNTSDLLQGQTFTQNLVQSYAQLATMPIVLDPVISSLGLNETAQTLSKSVSADNPLNTVIINVTATNPSPARAAAIADAVAYSLGNTASKLAPKGATGAASIRMSVTSPAQVPLQPIAPKKQLSGITGLLIGLAIGILYALLRHFLDTRVRTEADVQRASEAVVLGSIARKRRGDTTAIAMLSSSHGLMAEGYRRVRTNLEFAEVDRRLQSVSVTSAIPGEGKSVFSINLGLAMAERGGKVLIIDGDLRKPSLAEYCRLEGAVGLTTVLAGKVALTEAVQPLTDLVDVLTSGVIPPNPSQLLGSSAMRQVMASAGSLYDFVVVDTPPLLPAADALAMSHLTDGTIVMALYNSTRRNQLARALNGLKAVNARVLGVVINQVKRELKDEYYSYVHTPAKRDAAESAAGSAAAVLTTDEPATVPALTPPLVEASGEAASDTHFAVEAGRVAAASPEHAGRKTHRIRTRQSARNRAHNDIDGAGSTKNGEVPDPGPQDHHRDPDDMTERGDQADTESPLDAELAKSERVEGLRVGSPQA